MYMYMYTYMSHRPVLSEVYVTPFAHPHNLQCYPLSVNQTLGISIRNKMYKLDTFY